MGKEKLLQVLAEAQTAISEMNTQTKSLSDYVIPAGDVVAQTNMGKVTISLNGKIVIEPDPSTKQLQDSESIRKAASPSYWASASGAPCSRCGGTGRA